MGGSQSVESVNDVEINQKIENTSSTTNIKEDLAIANYSKDSLKNNYTKLITNITAMSISEAMSKDKATIKSNNAAIFKFDNKVGTIVMKADGSDCIRRNDGNCEINPCETEKISIKVFQNNASDRKIIKKMQSEISSDISSTVSRATMSVIDQAVQKVKDYADTQILALKNDLKAGAAATAESKGESTDEGSITGSVDNAIDAVASMLGASISTVSYNDIINSHT